MKATLTGATEDDVQLKSQLWPAENPGLRLIKRGPVEQVLPEMKDSHPFNKVQLPEVQYSMEIEYEPLNNGSKIE